MNSLLQNLQLNLFFGRLDRTGPRKSLGSYAGKFEGTLADGTHVRALLHVEDLVDGQCAGLAEALPAVVAFEGLLLGVDVPVVP